MGIGKWTFQPASSINNREGRSGSGPTNNPTGLDWTGWLPREDGSLCCTRHGGATSSSSSSESRIPKPKKVATRPYSEISPPPWSQPGKRKGPSVSDPAGEYGGVETRRLCQQRLAKQRRSQQDPWGGTTVEKHQPPPRVSIARVV